jgi:hypothetical protein
MQWPMEWVWIAVIVAVALLICVGLVMGDSGSWFKDSGKVPPGARADERLDRLPVPLAQARVDIQTRAHAPVTVDFLGCA